MESVGNWAIRRTEIDLEEAYPQNVASILIAHGVSSPVSHPKQGTWRDSKTSRWWVSDTRGVGWV